MDSASCPLLSTYLRALTEHLKKTPMLYEAELEALEELQQNMLDDGAQPSSVWRLRAGMCTVIGFAEAGQHLTHMVKGATDQPVLEGEDIWKTVEATLGDLVELNQAAAGEMGLLGLRRDVQQLEYAQLGVAAEVGEKCQILASMVSLCRTATGAEAFTAARSVGVLLSDVLAAAQVPVDRRLKYGKTLLDITDK